jgi:hypothetical protein
VGFFFLQRRIDAMTLTAACEATMRCEGVGMCVCVCFGRRESIGTEIIFVL